MKTTKKSELFKKLEVETKTPSYDKLPQPKKNLAEAKSKLAGVINKPLKKSEEVSDEARKASAATEKYHSSQFKNGYSKKDHVDAFNAHKKAFEARDAASKKPGISDKAKEIHNDAKHNHQEQMAAHYEHANKLGKSEPLNKGLIDHLRSKALGGLDKLASKNIRTVAKEITRPHNANQDKAVANRHVKETTHKESPRANKMKLNRITRDNNAAASSKGHNVSTSAHNVKWQQKHAGEGHANTPYIASVASKNRAAAGQGSKISKSDPVFAHLETLQKKKNWNS